MKKAWVAIFIIVVIAITVACCSAESDLAGTWYAIKFEKGGQEYDPAEKGLYKIFAFFPSDNKAFIVDASGNYSEGKWRGSDDHVLVTYTSPSTLLMTEGDFLTEYVEGGTLWFKKETDLQEPNDIQNPSEEDFYGIWKLNRVNTNGYWMSPRMLKTGGVDVNGLITISRESAELDINLGKDPTYWSGVPKYSDGKIYFNSAAFSMTDTDEIYLSSDGKIIYFKKIKPVDGWFCKTCGTLANGNYCYNCGQAYQAQIENSVAGDSQENELLESNNTILYRGEYMIGSDLEPGVYIIAVNTLDYDSLWDINNAAFRVYDYNDASQKWVENEYESGYKKGQRIKVSLKEGQKLKITAGSFAVSAYQAEAVIAEGQQDNSHAPWENTLYTGEYLIGTDLQPGAYVLSVAEMEYDIFLEYDKAAIRTYEYDEADRKWVKKDYESGQQVGQKFRITLEAGQKLDVEAGAFEITDFSYRAPKESAETIQKDPVQSENVPWMEYGVGSKIPKPFGVSGAALSTIFSDIKNSDTSFEATLSGSLDDFKFYVKTLKAYGFDYVLEEEGFFSIHTFKAKNSEGYEIKVEFVALAGIDVEAYAPGESPSYW